jgi:hypothetical protein
VTTEGVIGWPEDAVAGACTRPGDLVVTAVVPCHAELG